MKTAIAVLCVVLALMIGCDDDEDCVNCPGPAPSPTLQNVWPNADSSSWTYDYQMRQWEADVTIYPTRAQVPTTSPSWTEIFDLCESHAPQTPFAITDRVYTMKFNGMTTTGAGVTAQNLETALEVVGGANAGQIAAARTPALLRRLYAARPDLREKILSSLGQISENDRAGWSTISGAPAQIEEFPILVHGGPWEKASNYIGTYYNDVVRLAWKFLTSNLFTGSEFSYQLMPNFAEDLVLHCRVYRRMTVTAPAGTFQQALDCLYWLDYGITTVTDVYGDPKGYIRTYGYGRVIYAPTVGPVHSYERWGVEPGDPPSGGFMDITIDLTASSTLEN